MAARYHIGTSGWHYVDWIERFYPKEIPRSQWLGFYARHFPTVEINRSFYRLPTETAFAAWRQTAPAGFLFAVKASRTITHYKRLRNLGESLDLLLGRARVLGDKLGPVLYQLPPRMERDDGVLGEFLAALPEDLRHAIEFRHTSWFAPEVYRLLEQTGVALCTVDLGGFECPLVATADFVYHRFHGYDGKYSGCYPDGELEKWATKIADLSAGLDDAFVYFNNDTRAYAVSNALTLTSALGGLTRPEP